MAKPRGETSTERAPGRPARAPSRNRGAAPAAWLEARPSRTDPDGEPDAQPRADDALGEVDGSEKDGSEQTETPGKPRRAEAGPERPGETSSQDRAEGDGPAPNANGSGRKSLDDAPADSAAAQQSDPSARAPAPSRKRRQVWLFAALGGLIILFGGAGWYWFHDRAATRGGSPPSAQNNQQGAASGPQRGAGRVPVQVAEAKTADLPVFLTGLGTVQAYNTVVVRSRVDGEITQIGFQEGQMIQAGDLVAQIDPRPYQAALDQAIAKQKQDQATLASNRLDLERTRQLASKAYASQQQLDQQTATAAATEAQVAIDQAAISNSTTQFGYTTIRAPITGRTGLRLVDQGNIVHASDQTGIVEIAQIQPIAVIFTAPQAQLRAIADSLKLGPVEVAALSSDGNTVLDTGGLELINNAVDAASGTIRLKARFENKDDRLWPGLSVDTRLRLKTLRGVVAIPADAVQRGPNQLFAYVIGNGDKAEKRVIEVSTFTEGQAVIQSGLRAGERVVTAGQYRLTDGAAVQIAPGESRSQNAGQGGGTDDPTGDIARTKSQ